MQAVALEDSERKLRSIDMRFYGDDELIIQKGAKETDIFKRISAEQGSVVLKGVKEVGHITNPGEFFGEMASVLKQKRPATIISKRNSVVQVNSGDDTEDMIEEHPEIVKKDHQQFSRTAVAGHQKDK